MLSSLGLGFLIGLRHALEADHLAAVVSLATRGGTLRDHARRGALWGVGHTATLLILAGGSVLLGLAIPERAAHLLEACVGVMLLWLGASVLRRLRRGGLHFHGHRHADGELHWHAHAHHAQAGAAPGAQHAHDPHHHPHPQGLRALWVGAVHGLAGSASLVLLVVGATRSPLAALAYIGLFGLGSILGMIVLAGVVSLPLDASARGRTRLHQALCALAGVLSVALGARILWTFGA